MKKSSRRKDRPQAMTTGELIEELKNFPVNTPVVYLDDFDGKEQVTLSVYDDEDDKRIICYIDIGPEEL